MTTESPTVLSHAAKFYVAMQELAKPNEYHEQIFTGGMLAVYRETGASNSYYSRIRKVLVDSESITILQRGTGRQASEVRLNGLDENIFAIPLTPPGRGAILGSEVDRRLASLESWRGTTGGLNIAEVLRNFESRIARLESGR
jgi:hypothetical protein